jgi:hypothetical protein
MSGFVFVPDDTSYEPQLIHGSAHSISGDGPSMDRVEDLRKVVEEVTRKPVVRPHVKLGFY